MKNYEIMFILSTQLTDEEKQAGVALVENKLRQKSGETENWLILSRKKKMDIMF